MLDRDLAELYDVETSQLKRAVRRNIYRFPEDFLFELTKEEYENLRCQFGTLRWGEHAKYLPFAFTENGVAMLSSVLNSKRAILVNIQIMRAFVRMKNLVADNADLRKAIEHIEKRLDVHDQQIKIAFAALKSILQPDSETPPQLPAKEYSPGKEKKMGFGKASGKR
jgi:phage regulator Rha-like protein